MGLWIVIVMTTYLTKYRYHAFGLLPVVPVDTALPTPADSITPLPKHLPPFPSAREQSQKGLCRNPDNCDTASPGPSTTTPRVHARLLTSSPVDDLNPWFATL
ncbi:hypothetical protein EYZ11_002879 [Aspergillus tanneri]|uniref:Uncharacterized protein n=1 Tax=Aspergillus tanneri TaxID=1220188 RepID=A0A4S3JPP1_9EURO|nr:hypothetical protein EYZ11_002879 [Aspergillus tanneri]